MGPYAASLVRRNVPLVVDLVDVDSQKWLDYAAAAKGWRRWLYRLEGRRVRALEQRLLHQARAALLVTEAEVRLFQAALPNQKTFAVPNGVDLDYFRPGNEPDEAENECVFTGVLNYPPNVDGLQWFCGEVWPLVRQRLPESRFTIVGRNPTPAVQRLGRLPGVAVVGEVPDVRPFLARATVAVAPLRIARGIQNKVLEAMAMARPVIASPAALEGLEPAPGEAACRATTPSEWCARACELFGSPETRRRVGARARQFVEQHHSWDACLRPWNKFLICLPRAENQETGRVKGLLITFGLTLGGMGIALFDPFKALLVYVCFAILKPTDLWFYSVPNHNYSWFVALAMLVGWAVQGLGTWRLHRAAAVLAALVGFWGWSMLGLTVSSDRAAAWTFVEQVGKIVLPFVVGLSLIETTSQLRQLAWVMALSQGYLAWEFNLSYFSGHNRLYEGGIGGLDNNGLGIALVTGVGLTLFLGLGETRLWKRLLAWGLAALMVHAIMFSFSRGAMVALVAIGCVAIVLLPKDPKHLSLAALGLCLAVYMAGPEVVSRFSTTFAEGEQRDASALSRLQLWADCWDVMARHPVFGIGPNQWPLVAHRYGWEPGKEAHSLWFQTGAEMGLPGVLALGAFYGLCLVRLWPIARGRRLMSDPWMTGAACAVIASLTGFIISVSFVSLETLELSYYVVLLGAGILKIGRLGEAQDETPVEDPGNRVVGGMKQAYTDLLKHSLVYGLGQLLSRLASFLLLPLYTSCLTPADYGVIAILDVSAGMLTIVIGAGMAAAVNRYHFDAQDEAGAAAGLVERLDDRRGDGELHRLANLAEPRLPGRALARAGLERTGLAEHGPGDDLVLVRGRIAGHVPAGPEVVARFGRRFAGSITDQHRAERLLPHRLENGGRGNSGGQLGDDRRDDADPVVDLCRPLPIRGLRSGDGPAAVAVRDLPMVGTGLVGDVHAPGRPLAAEDVVGQRRDRPLFAGCTFGQAANSLCLLPFSAIWGAVIYEVAARPDAKVLYASIFKYFVYLVGLVLFGVSLFADRVVALMTTAEYHSAADLVPIICLAYLLFGLHEHFRVPALPGQTHRHALAGFRGGGGGQHRGESSDDPVVGHVRCGAGQRSDVSCLLLRRPAVLCGDRPHSDYPFVPCGAAVLGMAASYVVWRYGLAGAVGGVWSFVIPASLWLAWALILFHAELHRGSRALLAGWKARRQDAGAGVCRPGSWGLPLGTCRRGARHRP